MSANDKYITIRLDITNLNKSAASLKYVGDKMRAHLLLL